MLRVSAKNLKPGMVLAKNIYNSRGMLMVPAGTRLEQMHIEKLRSTGISEVFINDPRTKDIAPEEAVEETTRVKALAVLQEIYDVVAKEGEIKNQTLKKEIVKAAEDIASELETRRPQVATPYPVEEEGNGYFVCQSLNAAITAGTILLRTEYARIIKDVILGILLKDIGMMKVPPEILNKQEELTDGEKDLIRKHPVFSLKMADSIPELSAFAKTVILQHHERLDGSGYPGKIKGEELRTFVQIAGMADVYCAMICDRPYRRRVPPAETVEYLMSAGGMEFGTETVKLFCRTVTPYPYGSFVKLNTGETGVVIKHTHLLSRPVVRILFDSRKSKVFYDIDLTSRENQTKVITEVLNL